MEQRTEEWFKIRAGKLTASRIALALAKTKAGWGASRENMKAELAVERLTGIAAESFTSSAMQWGVDHEDEARAAYEFMTGNHVTEEGFVEHPTIENAGASPDGIVRHSWHETLGLLEIKCPNSATHIKTLRSGKADKKYEKQMDWQLACVPDAKFVDFVSYDPRMPAELMIAVYRHERDDARIGDLEMQGRGFLEEVNTLVAELERMKDGR